VRVLALSNLYPPQALGGYEMSCADVMTRWAAAGHEVEVLTTDAHLVDAPEATDVAVRRRLRWFWEDHRIVQPGRWGTARVERHNAKVLAATLREVRPDVVSVWAMGAMSLSLLARVRDSGTPSVWMVCDEWPVYGPRLDAWSARRGRPVPDPGDATLCWVSDYVRRKVTDVTGWQPRREDVTGSGIDLRDFPLRDVEDRPWRWRLLGVGRVEPRKGFRTAVEALALLPAEATLRIAGPDDGAHAAELRELAGELGVADRLTIAAVPRAGLAELYADSDAVLFTSSWNEPFGLVPLEAMACATPVVAAPTGGATEFLVDGTNCLAVPTGDAAAVAAACERLAADPALRRALVTAGLETAAGHTTDRLARVLERHHLEAARR
jgi:glycosyltransferase involved in cell wall biosynthesis